MTIVEFLQARLTEKENTARQAATMAGEHWSKLFSATVQVDGDELMVGDSRVADHIVENDPAAVLADVEAKRQIVDMHAGDHECPSAEDCCGWWITPCPTLHLLTRPFADHPSYLQEWSAVPTLDPI